MTASTPIRLQVFLSSSMNGEQIRAVFNGRLPEFSLRFVLSRESCFEKLITFVPEVILVDCQAIGHEIGGFAGLLRHQYPALKIIVLGDGDQEQPILDCIRAGADYYLFRQHLVQLPDLIHQILSAPSTAIPVPDNRDALVLLNTARLHILEYAHQHTLQEILQESLDQICQLTDSEIGFFHFMNADQKTITLQAWSTRTLETYCKAKGYGLHYDLDQAGVWIDCVREGRPVIHNDYAALKHKKGLPEGHAAVLRELVVPVYRDGLIVAILGVGNKSIDYDDEDIKTVSFFTDLIWDIAARKKIEEQLHLSDARFKTFIENANDTIFTLNSEGVVTYISPNWQDEIGTPLEDAIGKSYRELVHPDDLPYCKEFLEKVFKEGGKHSGLEYRLWSMQNGWRWHKLNATLLQESPDAAPSLLGISHDIMALKTAEEELLQREASVRKRLLAITSPDGDLDALELADLMDWHALDAMLDDFHELTNYGIGIIDLKGKVLVSKGWQKICTQFHRVHPDTLQNCLMSDQELTQNVMPGMFNFYKCKNNMWDISTPLMINDRHVGNIFLGQFFFDDEMMDLESFREQARRYGFDEEAYLSALMQVPRWNPETVATVMNFYTKLSSLISTLSYSNAQLARLLVEKDRLLTKLSESEQRYQRLVESAPTPILLMRDGRYTYANPAGLRSLGYETLEDFLGVDVMTSIHADSLPLVKQRMQGLDNGKANEPVEMKIIDRNGKLRITESTSVPIGLDGEKTTLILSHDITERKIAEEKLRAANLRLQALWNVASLTDIEDPKIISDHILETITRMTDSEYGFYGFIDKIESVMTIHSWSGRAMQECEIEDKARFFPIAEAGIWGDAVRSRKPILIENYETLQTGKKGLPAGHVPMRNLMVIPFFSGGRITAVAAAANSQTPYTQDDVTQITTFLNNVQSIVDRTKAENERKKMASLLKEAEQLTHTGVWEWDVSQQTSTWSEEVYRLHGITPEDYPNESHELKPFSLSCYLPEDRLILEKALALCVESGTPYELELRFQPYQGTLKWVRTIGKPVYEHGQVMRVRGYIMDITARKNAQLELQKQRGLLEISQTTAHLGSFEYDLETDTHIWTHESFNIFGLQDQLNAPGNKAYREMIHPEDVERVREAYQNSLASGEDFNQIYRIRRADGELRYIHNLGVPLYDAAGKIIQFIGTFQDITERKYLDLALQKSLQEKEVLLREVHHRVKNNLAAILGLIEMERYSTTGTEMETMLSDLGSRIKSIATVHETLYKSDDLSKIYFQDYLEALIENLNTSMRRDDPVRMIIEAADVELDLNLAVPCGLIINELITNALKHAFPADWITQAKGEQAEIQVTVQQNEQDYLLIVTDNGIGFPPDVDLHAASTLGLRLVRMLGEHQLGGKLSLQRNNGTSITLTFRHKNRE
jgi:PAS domain S-box-containing protein